MRLEIAGISLPDAADDMIRTYSESVEHLHYLAIMNHSPQDAINILRSLFEGYDDAPTDEDYERMEVSLPSMTAKIRDLEGKLDSNGTGAYYERPDTVEGVMRLAVAYATDHLFEYDGDDQEAMSMLFRHSFDAGILGTITPEIRESLTVMANQDPDITDNWREREPNDIQDPRYAAIRFNGFNDYLKSLYAELFKERGHLIPPSE